MGGAVWKSLGIASCFGLTAALMAVGGVIGGRWLDGRVHTTPLFTIVGLFFGLGAGFVVFVRQVVRLLGDQQRR